MSCGMPPAAVSQVSRGVGPAVLGLSMLLGCSCVACPASKPIDLAAERAALMAMHRQILEAHKNDDLDAWLALEAEEVIVGSRGELRSSRKSERAQQRREYLAQTEFTVYRDLREPIVQVAEDASLGWLYAQVEIQGSQTGASGPEPIHDTWAWIETYEKRPEGWRLVGNVSNVKPQAPGSQGPGR